jgi:hypothetical protein
MPAEHANLSYATSPGLRRLDAWACGIAGVGILVEVITGFGPDLLFDEVAGWPLLLHLIGAPVFIVGLTLMAIVRADRYRFGGGKPHTTGGPNVIEKLAFWIAIVMGMLTAVSMLAAMLPVFGYAGQDALIETHETGALLLVIAAGVYVVSSRAGKKAKR